jgi:HEPN domain-containing protein
MEEDIKYWIDLAEYDLKTAEAMFESRRYVYVLFTCQQAVEKVLKALVVKASHRFPPRTHDLLKLALLAEIDLDNEQKEFLAKLSFYYIESRYPEELLKISESITRSVALEYLNRSKEVLKWLTKRL